LESQVRRHGGQRGAGGQATARRERAAEEAGSGSHAGQRRPAVGDSKKRLELVEMKAAIEHLRKSYAFSERRACRLLELAVSTYRYRPTRDDSRLREQLVELARERPRFGYRRLHVMLPTD